MSKYIVYVDESGDHGLKRIDANYPIFVLAFCIFKVSDYVSQIVPSLKSFKFKKFGHDQIILHESDIRNDRGDFAFLKTKQKKHNFLADLAFIIDQAPFCLVVTAIRKFPYRQRYSNPDNPYHVDWAMDWSVFIIICVNMRRIIIKHL